MNAARLCFLVAACTSKCCKTDTVPEQLHLSLGAHPSEMVVSWLTYEPMLRPSVFFWEQGKTASIGNVAATTSTYTEGGWQGTIYNATLSGLKMGTSYRYRINGTSSGDEHVVESTFTTSAGPSVKALTPRSLHTGQTPYVPGKSAGVVAYFGDMSTTKSAKEVSESLLVLASNHSVQRWWSKEETWPTLTETRVCGTNT